MALRARLRRRGNRPARTARRGPADDRPGRARHAAADLEELALSDFSERIAAGFDEHVDVTVDREVRALAQPTALDRALIDNARRYGAEPIEITTRTRGDWIELHVIDQGAGFADEYLPRAFERFSRPTGARKGGAGRGLALVEAVAHTYGGEGTEPDVGAAGRVRDLAS